MSEKSAKKSGGNDDDEDDEKEKENLTCHGRPPRAEPCVAAGGAARLGAAVERAQVRGQGRALDDGGALGRQPRRVERARRLPPGPSARLEDLADQGAAGEDGAGGRVRARPVVVVVVGVDKLIVVFVVVVLVVDAALGAASA